MYAKVACLGLSTLSTIRVMLPPSAGRDVAHDASSKVQVEGGVAHLFVRPTRHIFPASATVMGVWYLQLMLQGHISQDLQSWQIIATLISVAGAALRIWSYHELGRFFTYELSIRKGHQLVQTGPYQYLMHPSYTAMFMTSVAWSMLITYQGVWDYISLKYLGIRIHWLAALVLNSAHFVLFLVRRVRIEEEMLERAFGEEFEEYRRKRSRFIPFVF